LTSFNYGNKEKGLPTRKNACPSPSDWPMETLLHSAYILFISIRGTAAENAGRCA
jgi:hypothetical protein